MKQQPLLAKPQDAVLQPFRPAAASSGYQRIELEYPVNPKPRSLRGGRAGERLMAQLAASRPAARVLIEQAARFHEQFLAIPLEAQPGATGPSWINGWFPGLDAVTLYSLLATRNPRLFVEVGSGNSTRFARRAIRDHGLRTQIISIDPCPRAEIDAICDQVVREPLENVDMGALGRVTAEDLLFVDSSHRSFQNSDVTVFFTEILPALPPGLVYGMHDIYLPDDYPTEWAARFYSEQYLLASYLQGGADGDEILAPLAYLWQDTDLPSAFARTFDQLGLAPGLRYGNSFWMRKGSG
ncbi:MAG: class I SAM-dependent methyltransferase [Planctomycetes bacterium]|nr:class I SAM-dependent methyltransferase [Planctomycetota bacterium]